MDVETPIEVKNNWVPLVFIGLLSALGTIIGSYYTLKGGEKETTVKALEVAYVQIERQQEQINRQQELIDRQVSAVTQLRQIVGQQGVEILQLKNLLEQTINERNLLDEYIESMPFPAWVKCLIEDELIVKVINGLYVKTFGITKNQYVNKTDYDVHPKNIADRYVENDMIVINTGKQIKFSENVVLNGGDTKLAIIYKFPFKYVDGHKCVGGLAVD